MLRICTALLTPVVLALGLAAPAGAATYDPATPEDVNVVDTGNRTVWLDFNDVEGATAYRVKTEVFANPSSVPTPSIGRASVDTENSTAKIAGLSNSVTYAFSVASVVNGTTSAYSVPVIAAPDPAGAPTNLRVVDIGANKVWLDWDEVDEATGYRIKTSVLDAHGVTDPSLGKSSTNTANSLGYQYALTNDVTYSFTVVAIVDGQEGPAPEPVSATPLDTPEQGKAPYPTTITNSSIGVKWAATTSNYSPVSSYKVRFTPVFGGEALTLSVPASQLTATATGLPKSASYRVQVAAANSAGIGAWSPARTYTVTNRPNNVRALEGARSEDGTEVALSWLPPTNSGGQDVYKYLVSITPAAAGAKTIVDLDGPSALVTGLSPTTTYKFMVRAGNDAGYPTTGASVTLLAGAPKITSAPTVASDGSVALTFSPLADDTLDYEVIAVQEPLLSLGAPVVVQESGLLQGPATFAPDSIDCDTACVATWDDFSDFVNGKTWTFKVRATDNINTFSTWDQITPPSPPLVTDSVVVEDTGTGQVIKFKTDWSARSAMGVYSMALNGSPVAGVSPVYTTPQEVNVELLGLGGSSSAMVKVGAPTPVPGDYKIGDIGPGGGIVFALPDTLGNTYEQYVEILPPGQTTWQGVYCTEGDFNPAASAFEFGTGKAVTANIMQYRNCTEESVIGRVSGKDINGYTDWFVPSQNELYVALQSVRDKLGLDVYQQGLYMTTTATSSTGAYGWVGSFGGKVYDKISGIDISPTSTLRSSLAVLPIRTFE